MGLCQWSGVAYNGATESENRIHADDVARRYGFRGGLVPGVTVYAYLVQPAIEEWGVEWLARGAASVVLRKPLYDGTRFTVEVARDARYAYLAWLVDAEGVVCAEGRVWLQEGLPAIPQRRGDPPVPALEVRPLATRETFERLRGARMGSLRVSWSGDGEMGRTTYDLADMHDLVRPDRGGLANPAFVLGLANWVLAGNVRLDAWIHTQSEARNLAEVRLGSEIVVEARISDLFERGGHEFVDLDVAAFCLNRAVMAAHHRAIYRLRDGVDSRPAAEPRAAS